MKKNEKGAILYLTVIVMTVISAMAIGMNVFFTSQIKMTKDISDSVKALYAADTGIERFMRMNVSDIENLGTEGKIEDAGDIFGDDYGYEAQIFCCLHSDLNCELAEFEIDGMICPDATNGTATLEVDTDCKASYFCYKSVGNYKGIKRAIEIKR